MVSFSSWTQNHIKLHAVSVKKTQPKKYRFRKSNILSKLNSTGSNCSYFGTWFFNWSMKPVKSESSLFSTQNFWIWETSLPYSVYWTCVDGSRLFCTPKQIRSSGFTFRNLKSISLLKKLVLLYVIVNAVILFSFEISDSSPEVIAFSTLQSKNVPVLIGKIT